MDLFNRESFLDLRAIPPTIEAVETPHGKAYVRVMLAGEKDRFEEEHNRAPSKNFRARVIIATCCDEQGKLLFTKADVPTISELPSAVIDPIVKAATRVNLMTEEAVEDARKNSEDPDDDDSSGSREPLDGHRRNSKVHARPLS
jgi:hypothetical protein